MGAIGRANYVSEEKWRHKKRKQSALSTIIKISKLQPIQVEFTFKGYIYSKVSWSLKTYPVPYIVFCLISDSLAPVYAKFLYAGNAFYR